MQGPKSAVIVMNCSQEMRDLLAILDQIADYEKLCSDVPYRPSMTDQDLGEMTPNWLHVVKRKNLFSLHGWT